MVALWLSVPYFSEHYSFPTPLLVLVFAPLHYGFDIIWESTGAVKLLLLSVTCFVDILLGCRECIEVSGFLVMD